jgi:hypothetical protein
MAEDADCDPELDSDPESGRGPGAGTDGDDDRDGSRAGSGDAGGGEPGTDWAAVPDEVPGTVRATLSGVPVAGAVCLEAGAGAGGATVGLLAAGAEHVVAVTNDAEDAVVARDRAVAFERQLQARGRTRGSHADDGGRAAASTATDHDHTVEADVGAGTEAGPDRASVVCGDLRSIPLPADSVDLITAHALCNVLEPADLLEIAAELTRVAAPDAWLVVDDYAPSAAGGAAADLFAVENAAAHLADGRAAYTFYPAAMLERVFAGEGWVLTEERTLLEPVPWSPELLDAHRDVVRASAARLCAPLADSLVDRAERIRAAVDGPVECGRMYGLQFRPAGAPEK